MFRNTPQKQNLTLHRLMHWLNYKEFSNNNKNKNAVARDRNRERGAREATGSRTQKENHRRNQRPKLTLKCACIVLRNLENYVFQKNIKRRSKTTHAYKTQRNMDGHDI